MNAMGDFFTDDSSMEVDYDLAEDPNDSGSGNSVSPPQPAVLNEEEPQLHRDIQQAIRDIYRSPSAREKSREQLDAIAERS